MTDFKVYSDFNPMGDQPEAIEILTKGVVSGKKHQVLMGVTGSGKTFTMAKIIEKVQKPTLVISHNKTLAAQLHGEFKAFFPDNTVKYFAFTFRGKCLLYHTRIVTTKFILQTPSDP